MPYILKDGELYIPRPNTTKTGSVTKFALLPRSKVVDQRSHQQGCCDCALVHLVDFRIGIVVEGGWKGKFVVVSSAKRDDRTTAQRRRRLGIKIERKK